MNNNNLGRREFGAATLTALLGGAAGCGSNTNSETRNQENSTETESPETTKETPETKEDVDQALKAMAYNLHDDLYTRGFDSGSYKLVDVRETNRDESDYRVRVDVDLDSIFHTAGMNVRGQDLHTARKLDMADDIFQDVSSQLNELTDMVDENFEHFYSEVENEVPVDLDIAIDGARSSSYVFTTNMQEEELEDRLRRFTKQPEGIGYHSSSPMKYEDLALMEEGESRIIATEAGNVEHTLEYIRDDVFRVNGKLHKRNESDMLGSFDGNRVYVSDIDPIYLQEEKEEFDGAVELYFSGEMEPEY